MPMGVPGSPKPSTNPRRIRKRNGWTTLLMYKSGGIFIKTRSIKYIEKLLELGFVEIMTAGGWHHSTYFSRDSGAIWTGTARELFSKKGKGMSKIVLAHCKVAKDEI